MSGIPDLYISISDIKNYLTCRQKWAFSSGLRGNWSTKATNKNLFVGSGAHAALEVYYKTPKAERSDDVLMSAYQAWIQKSWAALPLKDFSADHLADVSTEVALMDDVLKGYHNWALKEDKFTIDKPEDVEIIFNIPMPIFPGRHVYFTGKADALIKLDGKYFLMEHKTAAKMPDTTMLFLDWQCVAYQWAAQNDDRFVDRRPIGTYYNFVMKTVPDRPVLLKNGTLSKNKDMNTTYELYMESIKLHDLNPDDYRDILVMLKTQNKFHKRTEIKRTDRAMYVFGSWFMATVAEMLDPALAIYPNPDWFKCGWCDFKTPCQMVANGFSPLPVLKQDYMKREHYYPVLEEKE